MKLVNLTPHVVRLRRPDGSDIVIRPEPESARVEMEPGRHVRDVFGIPVWSAPKWGAVVGLPAPKADTFYIVSALVAVVVRERGDVLSPATGPGDGAIRDEAGQVWAVTKLVSARPA